MKDESGEEVEVLSEEEIEAEKKGAADAARIEAEAKATGEKTVLEDRLRELNEQLAKVGDKDFNFKSLEESKKKTETELAAANTRISDLQTAVYGGYKDKIVSVLADGDEDLKKMILHHYGRISGDAMTEAQIEAKAKEAYLLAAGKVETVSSGTAFSSVGGRLPRTGDIPRELVDNPIAKAAGLTQKDFEDARAKGVI